MLEEQPDWTRLVERWADDLLLELEAARPSEDFLRDSPSEGEAALAFRDRLVTHGMSLLAAARAGGGPLVCNNGSTTVDCTFVLRPSGSPYYRCLHSPPDCYDVKYSRIDCP